MSGEALIADDRHQSLGHIDRRKPRPQGLHIKIILADQSLMIVEIEESTEGLCPLLAAAFTERWRPEAEFRTTEKMFLQPGRRSLGQACMDKDRCVDEGSHSRLLRSVAIMSL